MKHFILVLNILAACGLILSAGLHAASLLGIAVPESPLITLLTPGMFALGVPLFLMSTHLTKGYPLHEHWRVPTRACPRWMNSAVTAFFLYAVLNFLLGYSAFEQAKSHSVSGWFAPETLRMFTGHWMVLYAGLFSFLYSARVSWDWKPCRRCPSGHPVSQQAEQCDQCGQPTFTTAGPDTGCL